MKKQKYNIIFKSDRQHCVSCFGFQAAIVLGMAWAIEKGFAPEINYIYDENGTSIKLIKIGYEICD